MVAVGVSSAPFLWMNQKHFVLDSLPRQIRKPPLVLGRFNIGEGAGVGNKPVRSGLALIS